MWRARIGIVLLIACATFLLSTAVVVRWLRPKVEPPAWANDYDLTAQPPELIAPGTVVERTAPQGWSHLVIKAMPRVKPSEVQRVPSLLGFGRDLVVQQVAWMFTVFTADVVAEQQGSHNRYRLRAIGLALGANLNGRDTVLTLDNPEFGQKLGLIQKMTLEAGYKVQKQSRVVVHGPSFALVDTPVVFVCDGQNRMIRFRYGLLVNAQTGRLEVFCWRLGAESGQCADLARAVLLNPNTLDEAEMIPDPEQLKTGANELSFGVDCLPPHRLEVELPADIRDTAGKTRFTPDEARTLEDALRKLLP